MTEREIAEVKGLLSVKHDGVLRKLFYLKNGLPRQTLYTNQKIMVQLGITEFNPNSLEMDGIARLLGVAMAQLRRQAKDAGLAWVDIEYSVPGGARIAHHGFSNDIDTIVANADKFEGVAKARLSIAKATRDIADKYKHLISA